MIQYFKNAAHVVDCYMNIKIGHQGVSISLSEHFIFHVKNKYHILHKVRGLMLELTPKSQPDSIYTIFDILLQSLPGFTSLFMKRLYHYLVTAQILVSYTKVI